jgi:hypothetical protein
MDEMSEEGEADGMEKSKESEDTYVPSGRLDSGITRSRVWGSQAIPAAVFTGSMGGRDIVTVWRD